MTSSRKTGKIIIPYGVFPERHELETASVFLADGDDVEFIAPSRTKGSRTPDVKINGVLWEMKTPMGKGRSSVANALRRAVKQSDSVIIDGRFMRLSDDDIKHELIRNIPLTKSLRRLVLITKQSNIIDLRS